MPKFLSLIKFLSFLFLPQVPFFQPVEGFSPQQVVREGRHRAESAIADKLAPLAQAADDCQEAYEQYKVYNTMSSTLSKVSEKIRQDQETSESLDKLEAKLRSGEFKAGRGAQKLKGTKSIYYMRAGNRARLYFIYSKEEKGAVEKVGETNKSKQNLVIDNLKQNYE